MAEIVLVIKFLYQLIGVTQKLAAFIQEKNLQSWLSELDQTVENGKKAETSQEKLDVAKKMVDLIGSLN